MRYLKRRFPIHSQLPPPNPQCFCFLCYRCYKTSDLYMFLCYIFVIILFLFYKCFLIQFSRRRYLPYLLRGNAHGAYVPVVLTAGGGAPWQRPDFSQQYCLLSAVPADHSSALQTWQVCQSGRGRPSSLAADSFIRVVIKTRRADAQPHSSSWTTAERMCVWGGQEVKLTITPPSILLLQHCLGQHRALINCWLSDIPWS